MFALQPELKVFSGSANRDLAERICKYIGVPLGRAIISSFPDGETYVKIEENIRGHDVFIIQPTCPPTNQHLMELLIMVDAARRASADRITAVIPFFGYARQDRKDQPRVPITAKLVANLLHASGVSRVLVKDTHDRGMVFEVESQKGQLVRGDLARAVVGAGWDLNELRSAAMSLEEVFLQLTGSEAAAEPEKVEAKEMPA